MTPSYTGDFHRMAALAAALDAERKRLSRAASAFYEDARMPRSKLAKIHCWVDGEHMTMGELARRWHRDSYQLRAPTSPS